MKWFCGPRNDGTDWEVFRDAVAAPTAETYGHLYKFLCGPWPTMQRARWYAYAAGGAPHAARNHQADNLSVVPA